MNDDREGLAWWLILLAPSLAIAAGGIVVLGGLSLLYLGVP
jgi:hypothetical protein